MKTIFKVAMGVILGVIIIVGVATCFFDSDEENTELTQEETEEYYENNEESSNDDEDNIAPGEDGATSSSWGDGTCRAINAKQFYQLVASRKNNETYIGEGPCVVDFWADWCGYCMQIDPYMKALAKKYKGKVQFYKVNADENEELLQLYGIDGLPTVFICSGEDIQMSSGYHSQGEFDKMIKEML
ncbi:MAG: thioredoxin family protein [Bacteroidaceae bacterium]|nr:thioredoxin family protein [Bacteroidaceae bacterium]